MRTTITLDPDVTQLLKKTVRERDITFKQAVNDAIRLGLKGKPPVKKRFRQRTFDLGMKLFPGDNPLDFVLELEDREMLRKMGLSK
jgi:hypothetical protein